MNAMTMNTEDLVARRVDIDEQLERLAGEKILINAELEKLGFGKHDAGDWTVSVRHNARLDLKKLEQRYSVIQYPQFYRPAIDTAAVREYLAPIELEQYTVEGQPIINVR